MPSKDSLIAEMLIRPFAPLLMLYGGAWRIAGLMKDAIADVVNATASIIQKYSVSDAGLRRGCIIGLHARVPHKTAG